MQFCPKCGAILIQKTKNAGCPRCNYSSKEKILTSANLPINKPTFKMTVIYPVLTLLYMGLIFYLSSSPLPMTFYPFSFFDKLVHIIEYGILASLIYLSLRDIKVSKNHLFILAFTISFLYGVSDEIHQYFVPLRQFDYLDIVADGMGILIGFFVFFLLSRRLNLRGI